MPYTELILLVVSPIFDELLASTRSTTSTYLTLGRVSRSGTPER